MQRILTVVALWLACCGVVPRGYAQQILCERILRGTSAHVGLYAVDLLRLQADSLRLVAGYQAAAANNFYSFPTTTALRRVEMGTCDTLPVPGGGFVTQTSLYNGIMALATRRGQVLIASGYSDNANRPIELRLLGRDGHVRWTRTLSGLTSNKNLSGLLEAPDRGFFVGVAPYTGIPYLLRLDSLGNVLWQKVLSRHKYGDAIKFYDPVYTRTGNILFHPLYGTVQAPTAGVMEITQNGDSLTVRNLSPVPTQTSFFQVLVRGSLLPLRDGGYAVLGQVDSAARGYYRPFLVRLDASLNVVWTSIYRPQAIKQYTFSHPYELADGSLVVLARNNNSGKQEPYWLFHYSASGSLQQRYAFTSALLPALTNPAINALAYFDEPVGLQPLSDSTFVLVANARHYVNNIRIQALYLAHLKVPGLRRVIDSHYIPATNSPLAAQAATAAFPAPAYPNPAHETVTVPLPTSRAAGQLVLTDLVGRQVLAWPVAAGAASATLPISSVAAGLYLLRLDVPGQLPATQRLGIGP